MKHPPPPHPPPREDLIRRARLDVASGEYEKPHILDQAVDGLLDELIPQEKSMARHITTPNRFLAFAFNTETNLGDGPSGGFADCVGAGDTVQAARLKVIEGQKHKRAQHYEIADVVDLSLVEEGDTAKIKPDGTLPGALPEPAAPASLPPAATPVAEPAAKPPKPARLKQQPRA
jgi:hypothetical protein